jgi:tyrosine-specific transport protein
MAALYFMEAHLWQKDSQSNLLSMTEHFFGASAKAVVWVVYLGLLYSLMCTYLLAGSSWVIESLTMVSSMSLSRTAGMLVFISLIGLFIFFGIRAVDHVNRVMSLGLAASFIIILWLTLPHVQQTILLDKVENLRAMPAAFPLLITAFGYSIIVPSLNAYFEKKARILQNTIIVGSLFTLLVYVLWEVATLGNIPLEGAQGLREIAHSQDNGTAVANALMHFTHNTQLQVMLTLFAVFAVVTSFLGVSMALYHALADGLKVSSRGLSGMFLLLLTYLPPMFFLMIVPTGFNQILSWAGALVAFLMGVIPLAMVWKGRYVEQQQGYRVFGGKALLLFVGAFFIFVVVAECMR